MYTVGEEEAEGPPDKLCQKLSTHPSHEKNLGQTARI